MYLADVLIYININEKKLLLLEFHENNFDHQGENRVTKIFEDYDVIIFEYFCDSVFSLMIAIIFVKLE